MVGVPRSTGCGLCVKRRVKCDQGKPGCGNCSRYGAECPGYEKSLKFVAGKHRVRPRRGRKEGLEGGPGSSASASNSAHIPADAFSTYSASDGGDTTLTFTAALAVTAPSAGHHHDNRQQIQDLAILQGPRDSRARVICALIHNLSQSQGRAELSFFGPLFKMVQSRLGSKVTLDSAICALTLHLRGKATGDEGAIAESRTLYGKSLTALQLALNHPVEWRTPETLCTAMVLCFFELFAGTINPSGWMVHARGVARVVQMRGPAAYEEAWDRTMLLSFRTIIIMNCMFSGEDCFLARKPWQRVMRTLSADLTNLIDVATEDGDHDNETTNLPSTATARVWASLLDVYFHNLARVPSILRRGETIRQARLRGIPLRAVGMDEHQVRRLRRDTAACRVDVAAWYAKAGVPSPREVPPSDPASPFQTVLAYNDGWIGSLHLGCWATLLILQEALNLCNGGGGGAAGDEEDGEEEEDGSDGDDGRCSYRESNRSLARDIFRSVEDVGRGLLGPMRVGYAVRIAYEFAGVDERRWLVGVLGRYETSYAATSPADYPSPETNEYGYG